MYIPPFLHFFRTHPHSFHLSLFLSLYSLLIETLKSLFEHLTMQSKKASSSVPIDTDSDDYIGVESCVDLKHHHTAADMSLPANSPQEGNSKRDSKMWGMGRKVRKGYPPPIPLLVRTESLTSHMPWVMKRHYTEDGRLILTEEKVRHHEFFRAHRSDGRLMLQLVAVNDQVFDESNMEIGDEEEEEGTAGGSEERKWCRDPAFMLGVEMPAGSLRIVRG